MVQYYFVGITLPPLTFDSPPDLSFKDFETLLKDNLTTKDYNRTRILRLLFDILNLRALWTGEELDYRGELTEAELEEAILNRAGLPDYVYDFVEKYDKVSDRIHHFPWLLSRFFKESAEKEQKGFLHEYLTFEREWRLVFTGFRAKKLGRDLSVELQYEDPEEELIAQMLAQKDAKAYEPPEKYMDMKILFEKYGDDPLALEKALDEYRFNFIEKMIDMTDSFSIDRILAYMAQLIIIEHWFALDQTKGVEIVDKIVKETS